MPGNTIVGLPSSPYGAFDKGFHAFVSKTIDEKAGP